jgi:hypothetical protein
MRLKPKGSASTNHTTSPVSMVARPSPGTRNCNFSGLGGLARPEHSIFAPRGLISRIKVSATGWSLIAVTWKRMGERGTRRRSAVFILPWSWIIATAEPSLSQDEFFPRNISTEIHQALKQITGMKHLDRIFILRELEPSCNKIWHGRRNKRTATYLPLGENSPRISWLRI